MCPAATMATSPEDKGARSSRPKTARGRRRSRAVSDDLDDPVTPPTAQDESCHSEEEDVFDEDSMATSPPLLPGNQHLRRTSVQSCRSRLQQPSLSAFRRSSGGEDTGGSEYDLLTYEDLQRATGMKVLSKLMDRQKSLQNVLLPSSGKNKKVNSVMMMSEDKPSSAAIMSATPVPAGKGKQPPRRLKPLEARRVYSD